MKSSRHIITLAFVVVLGKVKLSDRAIFGLLGAAVLSSANASQRVPDGLSFAGTKLLINEWWGRASDFLVLAATEPMQNVRLDFTNWNEP